MRTIYVIEGLGGEIGAWCRRPLIKAGFTVKWFPWWWTPKIPDGSILVGHSFGGGKAIRLVNEGKVKPSALITLDPRLEPEGGFGIPRPPRGPRYAMNFFQEHGLRGYEVMGMVNHKISDGTRHGQLPGHKYVMSYLKDLMVNI